MLNAWLGCSLRESPSYQGFSVVDGMESQTPSAAIRRHLQDLLRNARFDIGFLRDAAKYLGWSSVQARIAAAQPQGVTARRGEFGEVLSSAVLSEFHGYTIPVEKLRFAIRGDQSLPGTDIIALKLGSEGGISEVCFVESKLRTTQDTGAAQRGYEQLTSDHEQRAPEMLFYVAARLHDRRDPLFAEFMRYMRTRETAIDRDSFRLTLTWERATWSETVLQNLEDDEVELDPLTVHVVLIHDLAQLTDELFTAIGVETITDDE